jgi:hypothetical protein
MGLFFKTGSLFFSAVFAVGFVLLPSRSVQSALGAYAAPVAKHQTVLLFALVISAIISYVLQIFFNKMNEPTLPSVRPDRFLPTPPYRKLFLVGQVVLSLFVLFQVVHQWAAPLNWEDNYHFSNVIHDPWLRLNPFVKTEHHTLASLASLLSVKLFGMSKAAIEFPGLVFAAIYLGAVLFISTNLIVPAAGLILLLNLNSNQSALWFMHSMRGYIASMALTGWVFAAALNIAHAKVVRARTNAVVFISLCLLCAVTHLFAEIFCTLTFISLVVFIATTTAPLTQAQRRAAIWITFGFLTIVLPAYAYLGVYQMAWLERLGDFFKGGIPDISPALFRAVGSYFSWYEKISLLFLGFLVAFIVKLRRRPNFLTVFTAISFVFFFSILRVLEVRLLETRFMLPFLLPFLLWIGDAVFRIENFKVRAVMFVSTLFIFCVIPAASRAGVYEGLTENVRDFDQFITGVTQRTLPLAANCYTFSGEPNMVYFARSLYLGTYQKVKENLDGCSTHYHLQFACPENLTPDETRSAALRRARYSEIYRVGNMVLFREVSTSGRQAQR